MLLVAASTQGYWLTRSKRWESLLLLLVAFTLFRPGFWWDEIYEPVQTINAQEINQIAGKLPAEAKLQMMVAGETIDGKYVEKTVLLPLGESGQGSERLMNAGLEVRIEGKKVFADNVMFGSKAQEVGLDFDWEIQSIQIEADRPPKQLMFIPALLLLGFLAFNQRRRKDAVAEAQPA